jgi:siroheme synthase
VTVWLVGAGPGDPGLITARGLELVRSCDVLVYDRLVSPELVAEARDDAILAPRDAHEQAEINTLLVSLARQDYDVVRLKGGDPFVFGRGGEEALALSQAGIPFEVVPGVSALSAVPAALDYGALARAPGTLVLFMALGNLEQIAQRLIAHGRDPDTPAAVVSAGSTPAQQSVAAPLATIAEDARALPAPALVVVGDVVRMAPRIGARPQLVEAHA